MKKMFYHSYLFFIFTLLFSPLALAQSEVTVSDLLANSEKYDYKTVVVKGKVKDLKHKVSKRGNPYTVFYIEDKSSMVSVFSFGTLKIKNGDYVRVEGIFRRENRVGQYIFYNEIDASRGSVLKKNIRKGK